MTTNNHTLLKALTSLPQKQRMLIGFILIAVAILVQQIAAFTLVNEFTRSLSNWMHIPMFAGITATAMWIWPNIKTWKLALCLVMLALATEGIQFYTGRLPSIADLSKDGLGAAITWLCLGSFRRANYPAWFISIAVVTLIVPSTYLLSYQHQKQIFPTLFMPDDWRSMQLTRLKATGEVTTEHAWPLYSGKAILAATWHETRWPGVHLNEPIGDWQAYEKIRFDIFNLETTTQPVTLAVRHVGQRGTARSKKFLLQPGETQASFPVADLAYLDNGQPASIRHIMLYTTEEHAGKQVLLGRVWLE